MPGGAMVPFPQGQQIDPFTRGQVLQQMPVGVPSGSPFSPGGVVGAFQSTRQGLPVSLADFQIGQGNTTINQLPGGALPGGAMVPFGGQLGPSTSQNQLQTLQAGGAGMAMVPFRPTMQGARAQTFVAQNPVTGAATWFKPAGKPILWSGDLTACKRVGKIASRARRAKR